MTKIKCKYCKADLDRANPKFILQELTNIGYTEESFCDDECFIRFIAKKFKRKIRGMK